MRQEPKCAPCGCRLTYSLSHSRLLCLNWKIITEDSGISLSKVWLRNISSKMSFGWLQLHSEACFFIYTVDTDKSDFDRKTFMIWMKLINVMWCEGVFTYSRVRLCLCSPDPYVAVLLTPIPVRPVCDSMWDSQCVDVFRKREETHLAPHTHTALQKLPNAPDCCWCGRFRSHRLWCPPTPSSWFSFPWPCLIRCLCPRSLNTSWDG